MSRLDSRFQAANVFLGIVLAFCVTYGALAAIRSGVHLYLESAKDWTITSSRIVGDDVWISGYVYKRLECRYHPPPLSRVVGVSPELNLPVVSWSLSARISWPPSPQPQAWGPWQLVGAAKYTQVDLFQVFDCFDILPIGPFQVRLGSVDVAGVKRIQQQGPTP